MGAAETPIDIKTYSPGDPWTHGDFATLAKTAPRIQELLNAGSNTTPSYFESRRIFGVGQTVTVGVSSGGSHNVVLEVSTDGGDSWQIAKTYTTNITESRNYNDFVMLRLRVASGSNVTCTLRQGL